jgi:P pilus assembly chaperone PapD
MEQADGKRWLRATNPSAYYVSFGELSVKGQGAAAKRLDDKYLMVPPGGSERYELPSSIKGNSISVTWSGMNDWGGAGKEHDLVVGL